MSHSKVGVVILLAARYHHAAPDQDPGALTFLHELRTREALRRRLWPEPTAPDFKRRFREQELRRTLLSGMARLGHAFIDFYALAIQRQGSLSLGARRPDDEDEAGGGLITAYLDLLEAAHYILDVNAPDVRTSPLGNATRMVATLLGRQQPIGGMFGAIDQTLVRQFRMPGYPLVLITTDLLQEGEDLHTFCSAVHHYGISWMPSSMEQRVGRIDRVNSETERRRSILQVYYPHLRDTVEVLQVERVLERLNRFIRLMHRDLGQPEGERKQVHVASEMLRANRDIEPILEPLESAFPVREAALRAPARPLAVRPEETSAILDRFRALKRVTFPGARIPPFSLLRCVSPIGRLDQGYDPEELAELDFSLPVQIHTTPDERHDSPTSRPSPRC